MQFKILVSPIMVCFAMSAAACAPATVASPVNAAIPETSAQTCPAKDLQYLVGQSRTVLQTMRFGTEIRFEEPGQMYTQEFKASRTRIIIGTDDKIARILCG